MTKDRQKHQDAAFVKGLRGTRLLIWTVCAVGAVALTAALLTPRDPIASGTSRVVEAGDPGIGGSFSLVDHTGRAVTDQDYAGSYMLIYFGFASCPDVCPLALQRMSRALDLLDPEAELAKIKPLFITVDPERDTPEVLKTYLAFDPRMTGLTGEVSAIRDLAQQKYKVYAEKVVLEDSALGYSVDHSSLFYLMGPDGKYIRFFRDDLTPEQFAAAIRENMTVL